MTNAAGSVHYSGILILTTPGETLRCVEEVGSVPGVEVHYCYPESGRLIAVQETATLAAQEEGLRRIQSLATVKSAALVEHRIDEPHED